MTVSERLLFSPASFPEDPSRWRDEWELDTLAKGALGTSKGLDMSARMGRVEAAWDMVDCACDAVDSGLFDLRAVMSVVII